jgi:hypothetical protein
MVYRGSRKRELQHIRPTVARTAIPGFPYLAPCDLSNFSLPSDSHAFPTYKVMPSCCNELLAFKSCICPLKKGNKK